MKAADVWNWLFDYSRPNRKEYRGKLVLANGQIIKLDIKSIEDIVEIQIGKKTYPLNYKELITFEGGL